MTYSQSDVLKKIVDRTNFHEPFISIKKAFGACNMGIYWLLACDQIARAELIDMKHVSIDIDTPGNLVIDYKGVSVCQDVLERYLSKEYFEQMESYINELHEYTETCNSKLELWRKVKLSELVSFAAKGTKGSDIAKLRKEALAELVSRIPINKTRIWLSDALLEVYFRIRYRRLLRVITDAAKK